MSATPPAAAASAAESATSGTVSPPPSGAAAIPADQRVRKLSAAAPAWTPPETHHARTPSGGAIAIPTDPTAVRRLSTSSAASATSPPPPAIDDREPDDAEDDEELAAAVAQALAAAAASPTADRRPHPLLLKALLRQVEYLFSNQSLWKHAELATEMARDPLGLGNVDLSFVLAMREVQALTHELPTLVAALRTSVKLMVSPDAAQVRRLTPLPPYDSCRDSNRTIFVDRLPPGSTVASIKRMFSKFGRIVYVLRSDQLLGASGSNPAARGALTPFQSPKMKPQRSMSASEGSPGQIVRRLMLTSAAKPAAAGEVAAAASVQQSPMLEGMAGVGVGSLVHLSPAARNRAIASHASVVDPDAFTACFIHFDRPANAKKAVSHIVAFNKQLKACTPKGSPRVSARKNSLGGHGGVPLAPLGSPAMIAMGGQDSTPPRGGRSIRIMSAAQPTPLSLSPSPVIARASLRSPIAGPQKTPGTTVSPPPAPAAASAPFTEQKTAAAAAEPAPDSTSTPTNAAAAAATGSSDATSPNGSSGVAHEGLLSPASAAAVVVSPLPDQFIGLFVMPKLAYLKSVALKAAQKKDGAMLSPSMGSLSAANAAAAAAAASASTPNSAHAHAHSTTLLQSMPLLSLLGAPVFTPAAAAAPMATAAPASATKRSNQASPSPSKHAVAHASPLFVHQQPMIHIPIPASAQMHQQQQKEAAAAAAASSSSHVAVAPSPAIHPVSVLSARAPEFNPAAPSPLLKSSTVGAGAAAGPMPSFALGGSATAPAGIGSPQLQGRAQRDNWRSEGLPPSGAAGGNGGDSEELNSFHLQSSSSSPSFGPSAPPQFDEHGNLIPNKKQQKQQQKKSRSSASPALDGLNPEETGAHAAPRPVKLEGDRPKFSLTKRPSVPAVNGVAGAASSSGASGGGGGGGNGAGPQVLTRFAVGPDSAEAVGFAGRGRGGVITQPQLPPTHRVGAGGGKPL